MRVTVRKMPAPLMRAASSYSALAWANTDDSSRNASGDHRKPSTRIMPGMENTLNCAPVVAISSALSGPLRPNRNSQAMT